MIDIHCHILPNVDDGPADLGESLRMAKIATNNGILGIIATPHHGNGRYANDPDRIIREVSAFNEKLRRHDIPLTVYPGQEFYLHDWFEQDLAGGNLLPLAGTKYVLVEWPSHSIPDAMNTFMERLRDKGLRPIIAHPERYASIMRHPNLLGEWIEKGALVQITSHSLLGFFGKKVRNTAIRLCERGWVHFIASDAHHSLRRSFFLKESYHVLSGVIGSLEVEKLQNNASELLRDSFILSGK